MQELSLVRRLTNSQQGMICQDLLRFVMTSSAEGDGLGVEGL